jgi:hypothetical protein
MGGVCGTYGVEERSIEGIYWGDLTARDHLEDVGIEGRIILKWICNKWDGEE